MRLSSSIKMQFELMINRRSFKFIFSLMMLYNLISYLKYLLMYKNLDIFYFQTSQFLFSGNDCSTYWGIFEAVFPFLVVFPFAFSFLDDTNTGIISYIAGKMGKCNYYAGKLIVCFLGGFIIIIIPFFINLFLCSITFPNNNNTILGPYNLASYCETLTGTNVIINTRFKQLPMLSLYLYSPFLYNVLFIFLLSLFTGILSMFAGACSFFLPRHKLLLFMPVYSLFWVGNLVDSMIITNNDLLPYINFRWISYVHVNFFSGRNYMVFGCFIFILLLFCIISICLAKRKDIF